MSGTDFSAHNKLTGLVRERRDALTVYWLIATAVIGGYAIVLAALAKGRPAPVPWWMIAVCWGIAIGFTVSSLVIPRKLLADEHLLVQLQRPIALDLWARRMKLTAPQTHELAGLPPAEQSLFGLTMLFERPFLIALALSGGVGLCALANGLLTKTVLEAAPLLLAALAVNCVHYPRGLPRVIERGRKLTRVDDNDVALQALKAMTAQEQPDQAQPDQGAAQAQTSPQAPGAHARKSAVTEPNTAPLRPLRQTLGDRPQAAAAAARRAGRAESGPLSPQRPMRPVSGPLQPMRQGKLTPAAGMKRVEPDRDPSGPLPMRPAKPTPAAGMKRVEPDRGPSGPLLTRQAKLTPHAGMKRVDADGTASPALRAPKLTPPAGMKRVEPDRDPSQLAQAPRRPPVPDSDKH